MRLAGAAGVGARSAFQGREGAGWWRNGGRFGKEILARKRGNLFDVDDTRTNTRQHTQHAPDAPQNDSCSQLRVMCDYPAVFSSSSVRLGGRRRPFRHAFKSQDEIIAPRHALVFTLTVRSHHANWGTPRAVATSIRSISQGNRAQATPQCSGTAGRHPPCEVSTRPHRAAVSSRSRSRSHAAWAPANVHMALVGRWRAAPRCDERTLPTSIDASSRARPGSQH